MTAIVPLTLSAASDFVALWHRHLGRPVGGLFAVGIADADELVGAAIVGRPVARMMQDGTTAEVTRCCVSPGVRNGCSMLYGACWRAAKALGYRRLITYTQDGETGASLRAANYRLLGERTARTGWDTPSRRRTPHGADGVQRYLWEAS